jgi:hypothetical protein
VVGAVVGAVVGVEAGVQAVRINAATARALKRAVTILRVFMILLQGGYE